MCERGPMCLAFGDDSAYLPVTLFQHSFTSSWCYTNVCDVYAYQHMCVQVHVLTSVCAVCMYTQNTPTETTPVLKSVLLHRYSTDPASMQYVHTYT